MDFNYFLLRFCFTSVHLFRKRKNFTTFSFTCLKLYKTTNFLRILRLVFILYNCFSKTVFSMWNRNIYKNEYNSLKCCIIILLYFNAFQYFAGIFRSSRMGVFYTKGVFKNLANFTGKNLCPSLFLNKAAGLRYNFIKKRESSTGFFLWILRNF